MDGIQLLGGFIQNIPAPGINNRGEFHTKFAKKNEGGSLEDIRAPSRVG